MNPAARHAIEDRLASPITQIQSVAGGDINEAHHIVLADGRQFFIKTNHHAPPKMFEREAQGLDWMRSSDGLRVPKVISFSNPGEHAFLILEWICPGPRSPHFDDLLGSGLAKLHLDSPATFGWHSENFIGHLTQSNTSEPTWIQFYREQRLLPQMKMARASNRLSPGCIHALERLIENLEEHLPDNEAPARLHGDLWSGNVHVDEAGQPVLIDPAVYGGHREVDLAMMKLFGGFKERTFQAYHEAYPLEAGWQGRIELNQLYPLLVHVNLFGGHYGQSVERIAKRYS